MIIATICLFAYILGACVTLFAWGVLEGALLDGPSVVAIMFIWPLAVPMRLAYYAGTTALGLGRIWASRRAKP